MAQIDVLRAAPEKGDLPFHPFCVLELSGYGTDAKGRIHLSPTLMTPDEIDYWTDDLIEQLNRARKKAKRHLEPARGSLSTSSPR